MDQVSVYCENCGDETTVNLESEQCASGAVHDVKCGFCNAVVTYEVTYEINANVLDTDVSKI